MLIEHRPKRIDVNTVHQLLVYLSRYLGPLNTNDLLEFELPKNSKHPFGNRINSEKPSPLTLAAKETAFPQYNLTFLRRMNSLGLEPRTRGLKGRCSAN
jgi:hypothetical protein